MIAKTAANEITGSEAVQPSARIDRMKLFAALFAAIRVHSRYFVNAQTVRRRVPGARWRAMISSHQS